MTKVPPASCLVRICEDKRIPSTDGLLKLKPVHILGPVFTMTCVSVMSVVKYAYLTRETYIHIEHTFYDHLWYREKMS